MKCSEIIKTLKTNANPTNVAGMARYGICARNTLGVSIPFLRTLAKKIGKDHALALELWDTDIHEARILAGIVDNPKDVTEKQMEKWVKDFESWDICDQVVSNLFD
ncbi:MAG: DNA alkylation repair protein, partial [Candidatus Margulisiibacteriota bacterium]